MDHDLLPRGHVITWQGGYSSMKVHRGGYGRNDFAEGNVLGTESGAWVLQPQERGSRHKNSSTSPGDL